MGVRKGAKGGAFASPGFGHLLEDLIKILKFGVRIIIFGQNALLPPEKLAHPTKIRVDGY